MFNQSFEREEVFKDPHQGQIGKQMQSWEHMLNISPNNKYES